MTLATSGVGQHYCGGLRLPQVDAREGLRGSSWNSNLAAEAGVSVRHGLHTPSPGSGDQRLSGGRRALRDAAAFDDRSVRSDELSARSFSRVASVPKFE